MSQHAESLPQDKGIEQDRNRSYLVATVLPLIAVAVLSWQSAIHAQDLAGEARPRLLGKSQVGLDEADSQQTFHSSHAPTSMPPPNIVVIFVDDLGYNDLGFTGSTDIVTPNIDRLAASGVVFENGLVASPVCAPSRAALLTGRYATRFGMDSNIASYTPHDPHNGLPLSEKMFSSYLQEHGYRTGVVGKWHMGTHPQLRPHRRGFDYFYGFVAGSHNYFRTEISEADIGPDDNYTHLMMQKNGTEVGLDGKYLTDALTDHALEFLQDPSEQPFFLYLPYNAPHGPLQAPSKLKAKYVHIADSNRRTYLAMIDAVDQGVGRVLDALAAAGQRENTLVFFLNDNGGVENSGASNAPYRGAKSSLFEGGIHVPFIASWPARWPQGTRYAPQVISMDIAATALALAGIAPDPQRPLDGVNLDPFVRGVTEGVPHDILFWRRWQDEPSEIFFAARTNQGKLLKSSRTDRIAYFNLTVDPNEQSNQARHPDNQAEITRLLAAWNAWNRDNPGTLFLNDTRYEEARKSGSDWKSVLIAQSNAEPPIQFEYRPASTSVVILEVPDTPPALSPDFNGDGQVEIVDFLLFVQVFGTQSGQENFDPKFDLNSDGTVDISDFLIFVDSFGKTVNG